MARGKRTGLVSASPRTEAPLYHATGAAAGLWSTPLAPAGFAATPLSTPPSFGKIKESLGVEPGLLVGAQVRTKVINVTNFIEDSFFLRALAKEVFITGKVLEVVAGRYRGWRKKTDLLV